MPKEPNEPAGSRDRSPENSGPSDVSFFDPKGENLGGRSFSGPGGKKGLRTPGIGITEERGTRDDDNPVPEARGDGNEARSAHDHAEELGEALYAKFMHILKKQAAESEGPLNDADIEAMGQAFRAELEMIETAFVKAVEDYAEARQPAREQKSRTRHFHRLLVHNFEHRFADETELHEQPEKLSRRMLPGFFNTLQLMLGEQRLARFEKDARDVVDKLRDRNRGKLDWAEVYRSPDARTLCFQAEVEIARHFTELEKRLNWMVAVLNANLIPAEKGSRAAGWEVNRRNAALMLSALIRDLRGALSNQKARLKMEKKMGPETVTLLHAIARRFGEVR